MTDVVETYQLLSGWTLGGYHLLVTAERRGDTENQTAEFITPKRAERIRRIARMEAEDDDGQS